MSSYINLGPNVVGAVTIAPPAAAGEVIVSTDANDGKWGEAISNVFAASGDLSGSSANQVVVGIEGQPIPAISRDFVGSLTWNGTLMQWMFTPAFVGYAAGGDLDGYYPNPGIAQITGATGNFDWLSTVINPTISHLPKTVDASTTNLTINAQDAWSGAETNVYGGSLIIASGKASDNALGASITLDGASPRSIANASDIAISADHVVFSAASTASANTLILDPINAAIYFNSASPTPSIGTSSRYFTNTYTNNIYVNQITNTTAPTAGQFLSQNSSANGIEWLTISGDLVASSTTPGQLNLIPVGTAGTYGDGYNYPVITTDGYGRITVATQLPLNLPTSLPPNGAASGDLDASYPNPTVAAIQGNPVSSTAPTPGQILIENSTATGSMWSGLSGDIQLSSVTPGATTVVGLDGNPLNIPTLGPSQDGYVATWVNADRMIEFVAPSGGGGGGGGFTAGGDLSGSSTSQEVIGLLGEPLPEFPMFGVGENFNLQFAPNSPFPPITGTWSFATAGAPSNVDDTPYGSSLYGVFDSSIIENAEYYFNVFNYTSINPFSIIFDGNDLYQNLSNYGEYQIAITITDVFGNAGTYPIVISDTNGYTINGNSNYTINNNYGSVKIIYAATYISTQWVIVASH